MAVNGVFVQYNGDFLPDILLLTQAPIVVVWFDGIIIVQSILLLLPFKLCTTVLSFVFHVWWPGMAINVVSVQYNGGFLPEIIMLTQVYYHRGTHLNAMKRFCICMEALLYGCMTWASRNAHYRQLRTTHHKLLLRVIGYHRVHGTYRKMSNAKALKKTGSQSLEATIRQRRLLFAGALARQDDKRLTKRLLSAEISTRRGGRPGTRPAGTALLAEKLEGQLQGIRSSTRLHAN